MPKRDTLDALLPGEGGVIASVANSDRAVRRRLTDMGLTPGTEIRVKKRAPFGDPIEVTVRGYELSLRRGDAAQIGVAAGRPERRRDRRRVGYSARPLDPQTAERMRLSHENEREYLAGRYDGRAHDSRLMRVALAGNPNSGKTTLYNALTGSEQYVGNWPGVTVEKKEGRAVVRGREIAVVDLPGVYSLSPYSQEELVTRGFIIDEAPDAIINIVDATNLERNLYLTVQLLELERPMVVALNFMDEAEKRGDRLDAEELSRRLGVPVIPITARTGENVELLMEAAHRQMHIGWTVEPDDLYGDTAHRLHHDAQELILGAAREAGLPAHWACIKLIEGDPAVTAALKLTEGVRAALDKLVAAAVAESGSADREAFIADSRYAFIEETCAACYTRGKAEEELSASDRIDRVLTHRIFALPIFLAAMLLVFAVTFGPVGSFLSDAVAFVIDEYIAVWVAAGLAALSAPEWMISLFRDGVVAGVGGVLTFLPQIALLFLFLSLLEDSGYMARAAFIMDRPLRRFGLSGKAFIPLLMGFGCTVPAVMGARTMENERDRRMTILLTPFMSCAARLPVYGLIAAAFFGGSAGLVVFSLYVLGMLTAVASGILFRKTLFRGKEAPFVMELPPYRMPTIGNTLRHVWDKVRGFLVRAGTLIFVMSVVLWFLQSFDMSLRMTDDAAGSILGVLGGAIAPVFRPMGFGNWQASVALLTGLIAKESVVASLSMFCGFSLTAGASETALALGGVFGSGAAALAFLVFVLLYVPCVAAVSAIYREMNSLKWTAFSVLWQMACAWGLSLLTYLCAGLVG